MTMHQLSGNASKTLLRNANIAAVLMIAAAMIVGFAGAIIAGNSASARVSFSVEEISALQTTGTLSHPFVLTSPEPGVESRMGDGETYLQYTSLVPEGKTHTISAAITSGSLPSGCALKLEVVNSPKNLTMGTIVGNGICLSNNPRAIIVGIGNLCTGSGSTDGPQIAYRLIANDPAKVVPNETTTVTVSFTLN